jgi:predicted HicB family RNase H-like nuclease
MAHGNTGAHFSITGDTTRGIVSDVTDKLAKILAEMRRTPNSVRFADLLFGRQSEGVPSQAGADRDQEAGGAIVSMADHYTYRVHWSAEDGEYVGTVAELPSVSWLAEDRLEAFVGVQRIVEEIVAEMLASGEEPPVAIADKHYSGKFQVRVPEEVHRRLAIRAAEQGVSLNALASSRLASA